MDIVTTDFPEHKNHTGALTVLEGGQHIPFDIARVYYIYEVPEGEIRGHHAHKTLQQYLICLQGTCEIMLDDGKQQRTICLTKPNRGLFVGVNMWRTMKFQENAILLVLASAPYEEEDYIRQYEGFLQYLQEQEGMS